MWEEVGGWRALGTGKPVWARPEHLDSTAGLRARSPLGWREAEECDYPLKGSMQSLGKGGGHMPTA